MIIKLAGRQREFSPEEILENEAKQKDAVLQQGIDNLAKKKRQKSSTFRGASRSGSPTEHFQELSGRSKPKKVFLRALAKLNKKMPDVKEHPTLNRMARVIASTVGHHPKTVLGATAGVIAGGIAGLTVMHHRANKV